MGHVTGTKFQIRVAKYQYTREVSLQYVRRKTCIPFSRACAAVFLTILLFIVLYKVILIVQG